MRAQTHFLHELTIIIMLRINVDIAYCNYDIQFHIQYRTPVLQLGILGLLGTITPISKLKEQTQIMLCILSLTRRYNSQNRNMSLKPGRMLKES